MTIVLLVMITRHNIVLIPCLTTFFLVFSFFSFFIDLWDMFIRVLWFNSKEYTKIEFSNMKIWLTEFSLYHCCDITHIESLSFDMCVTSQPG